MTSMFIRCSAWFGSVGIGFLAPEIFIRDELGYNAFENQAYMQNAKVIKKINGTPDLP